MGFTIGTGGGGTATVTEPTRANFSENLRGAIEYSLAHAVYKGMELMGGALGAFVAGLGVQLLDRLEPSLVKYTVPLIDMLLAAPELPAGLRTFLTQIKTPTDAGGAVILEGLATSMSGQVASSILGVLTMPTVSALNSLMRPSVPSVADVIAMERRGVGDPTMRAKALGASGYKDTFIDAYRETQRPRAGIDDLFGDVLRNGISQATADAELVKRGYTNADINVFHDNLEHLLDVNEIFTAQYRHKFSPADANDKLKKLGYPPNTIDQLRTIYEPRAGPSDVVRFALREAFNESAVDKYGYDNDRPANFDFLMGEMGYNPTWAKYYWRAHWELPSASMGYEMLHRRKITPAELDGLLKALDYPTFWRPKMAEMSYDPLTRVDVRRMYKIGVVTRAQVKSTYQDLGYDAVNAELLTRFTELTYPPDGEDPTAQKRDLTADVITASYKKDLINRAQAITMLVQLGYDSTESAFMVDLADAQRGVDLVPDYPGEHLRDLIAITERAYLQGNIDANGAKAAFTGIGLSAPESQLRVNVLNVISQEQRTEEAIGLLGDSYVARTVTRTDVVGKLGALGIPSGAQTKLLAAWEAKRDQRTRRLSESQYRNAYDLGQITIAEYTEDLRGLGYSEKDAIILAEQAAWYVAHGT